ncbi:MAG: glycoside hydrolase family 113 [Brevefilum sp.]
MERNEKIVLEVLDDVSGLPYNSSSIELKPSTDLVFLAALRVPTGSVIKYRYVKVGQFLTPEATTDGQPVEYRLYYATDNALVEDILLAWQAEPVDTLTGILRGTVLEEGSDQPIPDILISAGGMRTFTDANGKFIIKGLTEGIHNVVFYALDGKFRSYQQGAAIQPGMTTQADVVLAAMPEVIVTFEVTPPDEALGAPVFIAGNIFQLGNTFTTLSGGASVKPARMPALTANEDGTLTIKLRLHAETDLRYKFTLGDGYWNAEQNPSGGFRVRQLIVPNEDVTITHTIETWGSPNVEPITFSVSVPPESSPNEDLFIQFTTETWMDPLPLWPLGNGQYLFILYSPLDAKQPVNYRFCRLEDCSRAADAITTSEGQQVKPTNKAQTINLTMDRWQNWTRLEKGASVQNAYIPVKPANYGTIIELTPEMDPAWLAHAPQAIANLSQMGVDTIIFSPAWRVNPQSPYLNPIIGQTPFLNELLPLLNAAQSHDLASGLYPQLSANDHMEIWWLSKAHTEAWWNEFFSSYRDFALNYAKIADISGAKMLILGGKHLSPAFEGGIMPDGSDSNVPVGFDSNWLELLADIRDIYSGEVLWAAPVNRELDPLPKFLYSFDGIYLIVDTPLALGDHPTFEMIQSGFTHIIDSQIYEVYRSQYKPIILAAGYPAVETAASGCALLSESCYNDGLFSANELIPYEVNLQEQALIYNAIMPIIASRPWITGVSIRGYDPGAVVHDGASSIAGKPAQDVIQYWYTNMKP